MMKKKRAVSVLAAFLAMLMIFSACSQRDSGEEASNSSSGNVSFDSKNNVVEKFDYPTTGNTVMDEQIKSAVDTMIADYKEKAVEQQKKDDNFSSRFKLSAKLFRAQDSVSVVLFSEMNSPSFSSPAKDVTSLNFNTEGKALEITEFIPEKYLAFLTDYAPNYFGTKTEYKDKITDSTFQQGIAAKVSNFQRFALDDKSIVFYFIPNQLFSTDNVVTMVVPKTDIKNYISKQEATGQASSQPSDSSQGASSSAPPTPSIPDAPSTPGTPVKPQVTRVIDPAKPMVALTFDDGPHYKYTAQILDALKKYNGAATFFMLGPRVPSCAAVVKRMVEEGSQLGNHTYNHKSLVKLGLNDLLNEVEGTNNQLLKIVGKKAMVIRPPYGAANDFVRQNLQYPMINWNVDTQDWKTKNTQSIIREATKNVHDGDIILMHDIYPTTAAAVEEIARILTGKGYQLVTIQELFTAKGIAPVNGEVYYSIKK